MKKILFIALCVLIGTNCTTKNNNQPLTADVEKIVSKTVASLETKKEIYQSEFMHYKLISLKVDNIEKTEGSPEIFNVSFSGEIEATQETKTFQLFQDLDIKERILSDPERIQAGGILKIKGSLSMKQNAENWDFNGLQFSRLD